MKKIFSYLLVFLCTLLACFGTLCIEIKMNLTEKSINTYLKNSDLTFLLESNNAFIKKIKEYFKAIQIPEDTLKTVLNSEVTKAFAAKYLNDAINYIIYEKEAFTLQKEDVENLVTKNMPVVKDALKGIGFSLSEKEETKIYSYAEQYAENILDFFPTAKEIIENSSTEETFLINGISLQETKKIIKLITDISFIFILIGILIFFLFLLWIINRGKRAYYFKIGMFLYAFVFILIEILLNTIVKEKFMIEINQAPAFVNHIINEISKVGWGIILLALGISFILSRIEKKGGNNEKIFTELCEGTGEEKEKSDNEF